MHIKRLRIASVGVLLLCTSLLLPLAHAKDAPTTGVPRYAAKTLFESTSARGASFSHDEKMLLLTMDTTGVFNAYTVPVGGGDPAQLTHAKQEGLYTRDYFPHDGRVLLSGDTGGNERSHLMVRELDGAIVDITPGSEVRARFLGWQEDGTSFYASTNEKTPQKMDVYRFEVGSATPSGDKARYQRTLIAENPGGFGIGDISRDGRWLLLAKSHSNADGDLYLWDLKHPGSKPDLITAHEGDATYEAATFTPDSKALFYATDLDAEFSRLWSFDLSTKKHQLEATSDWDINQVQFSEDGRWRLIRTNADAESVIQLRDRRTGKDLALEGVPTGQVLGTRFSPSGRFLALYVDTDRAPADLYVRDLEAGTTRRLTHTMNPAVSSEHLVEAQVIRYPSFDGLEIPALLYRPQQATSARPVPALLWVHGGPGGQSRKGYRATLQYLANHGFAILAVNNRGSSGYGKTFHHLDDRRHGDVDLKDCIWGRRYLETLDWIDPDRIGIMGGSYGGYMTVAALAFEPDAFDIGIDIFGVTNWLRTLKSIPPWWAAFRKSLYDEIGDPATDEERLRKYSPLFHADKIRKPLLVVQGANDPRVLKAESDEIVAAVKKSGVPVEYLLFEDEGHGFRKRVNRIRSAEASRAFAERYLKDAPRPRSHPLARAIDAQVRPYVDAGRLPGLVVGIVDKQGSRIRGYGAISEDDRARPTQETVYEIGSISKVFTGILLAALANTGRLALDDEVQSFFPASLALEAVADTPMTLRHLSTHSSGLPRMPANFRPTNPEDPYVDYSADQLQEALKDMPRRKKPGMQYAYSNLAVGLLGHLLSEKAGVSYDDLLRTYITGPLNMTSTSVQLSDDMRKRLAPGHDERGSPKSNWNLGLFAGAGGIRSTAKDMLTFLAANLATGERPLDAAMTTAREIHSPHGPGKVSMGLGWHVVPNGVRLHSGQTGGYHSFAAIDRERGFAVLVLSNYASGLVDQVGDSVGRVLAGVRVPAPKVARLVRVDPTLLNEYVGRYELQPEFVITITAADGVLFLQATGQEKIGTRALANGRFRNDAARAEIEFERDEENKVARLILHQNGAKMPAQRLPE